MTSRQQDWIGALGALRDAGTPCALVTVTGVRGSAPREPGARMIVADGRLHWGTIGGGNLEHLAIEHALQLIAAGEGGGASVAYPLSEKVGQCCGGEVTLFYETLPWNRRRVVIFGAGHVAQALGGLAPYLGADVLLIDERSAEALEPPLPAERPYEVLFIDAPEAEVDTLQAGSLVVIMTHNHARDLEILERAVRRADLAYLGLIGSERKWARFQKRLLQRGASAAQIARVRCPIGLTRTSKEPTAIALSTAAELLDVMERTARGDPVAGGAGAQPTEGARRR
jgi:xanthine dehydrogenase accessory factor